MSTRHLFVLVALCAAACSSGPNPGGGETGPDGSGTSGDLGLTTGSGEDGDPGGFTTGAGGQTSVGSSTTTGAGTTGQGGGGTATPGACCAPSDAPGCAGDGTVEQCVCAQDAYCCDTLWDETCVELIDASGCGVCGGSSTGSGAGSTSASSSVSSGTGGPPPSGNECCTPASGTPGCADPAVQDCVCAADPYCCQVEWDDLCVQIVESSSCGTCT